MAREPWALPNEAKRSGWLEKYANYGPGVLLGFEDGTGCRINALDVDDDRLERMVLRFLGFNRAERRPLLSGKRGKKHQEHIGSAK